MGSALRGRLAPRLLHHRRGHDLRAGSSHQPTGYRRTRSVRIEKPGSNLRRRRVEVGSRLEGLPGQRQAACTWSMDRTAIWEAAFDLRTLTQAVLPAVRSRLFA